MAPKVIPIEERFWSKVDVKNQGDCWNWTAGTRGSKGYEYGGFRIKRGVMESSHRMAYILTFGEIPDDMIVCHRCDNAKCCNPHHLFLGTHDDNAKDRVMKGRSPNREGENNTMSVFTREDVIFIRENIANGEYSQKELSTMFGVSKTAISLVVHRRRWVHLK